MLGAITHARLILDRDGRTVDSKYLCAAPTIDEAVVLIRQMRRCSFSLFVAGAIFDENGNAQRLRYDKKVGLTGAIITKGAEAESVEANERLDHILAMHQPQTKAPGVV